MFGPSVRVMSDYYASQRPETKDSRFVDDKGSEDLHNYTYFSEYCSLYRAIPESEAIRIHSACGFEVACLVAGCSINLNCRRR